MDRKKIDGWLDGYENGWNCKKMDGWLDGLIKQIDGWLGGKQKYEKIDGWFDGYKNRWIKSGLLDG